MGDDSTQLNSTQTKPTLLSKQSSVNHTMDGVAISEDVLWRPDPTKLTRLDEFRRRINDNFGLKLDSYEDLYEWSTENYSQFWEEFWKYSDIIHSQPYTRVVDVSKRIDEIPDWFVGARLNYAENLLRHNDDKIAVYSVREDCDKVIKKTFLQLRERVTVFAAAFRHVGIQKGDRIAGYLPNCCEAIEAMLAAASIGAIWTAASPELGVSGVLDRFRQVKPSLILSVDAVVYNGKVHDNVAKLQKIAEDLPGLQRVVVIPVAGRDTSCVKKCIVLEDFLNIGLDSQGNAPLLEFAQLPFCHPLFILFSSGTTGAPKCMVHSAGGTLIQHLKEHLLHGNISRNDIMMYFTTTGWMMWNWMVSSLAAGSAVVLYDGSPIYPAVDSLWDVVDKLRVTIFGTGAKWLDIQESKQIIPKNSHKLDSLHTILSTGSPLSPRSFRYVYKSVKQNVLLGSITGGTDIISCFAGQNPTIPVHVGEIQSRNLGMAVQSWNEYEEPVWGSSGELVCLKPFPSMPTHFWNDPNGSKYRNAYFNKFEGVWAHGDFCQISSETGGVIMLGRSDGTLNPNGVRFGSAEIYNIVEQFKDVQDSLCVAQLDGCGDERVVLFLKMAPERSFTEELVQRIRAKIRQELSPRHVPAIIVEIQDIPYTSTGKKIEIAVKKILAGEDITNKYALANPEVLQLYYDIRSKF